MVNQRKRNIVDRLCTAFLKYKQCVVVAMDNVSTNQIHNARTILKNGANPGEMIVGKNTLVRKALKFVTQAPDENSADYEDHKKWSQDERLMALEPLMKNNVGLIFSEEPYVDLRRVIEAEVIKMPPRTGVIAPCDVVVPAGPTGIDVGKIDLFHKLNISCKTVKSAIEVAKDIKIIFKEKQVGEGAVRLCKLLNIVPFEYKLEFKYVYLEGTILDQSVLDYSMDDVRGKIKEFATQLTALAVGGNVVNSLSMPHFIGNAFKSVLAVAEESGYALKALEDAKKAGANTQSARVETKAEAKKEAKVEAAPEEEEEEEDASGMMDMFG